MARIPCFCIYVCAQTLCMEFSVKFGIGIDTGGTYTDAVVYDFTKKKIISSAKALTTKEDLSKGILRALDSLDEKAVEKAEIISLSTTLATNACVENKGGNAKLLFIGVDRETVDWVGGQNGLTDHELIYYLDAKVDGENKRDPDWQAFLKDFPNWIADADALGIVQLGAPNSGAIFERRAKELISERYDIPIICGYELFNDLNAIKRGASALLNGRLIPVLAEFLDGIKTALSARNIKAPVAIVRSDGSLMSEQFTGARPVETILCGPAASVVGANALEPETDAVIVDMGGTTTDIALVRGGLPVKVADGVNIGSWRTFVKGVYVETLGLGGDSAVRFDKHPKPFLDTCRVIPISTLAVQYEGVQAALEELMKTKRSHSHFLHEFFVPVKRIIHPERYTKEEQSLCKALENGPLIYSKAALAYGKDIYNFDTRRLERDGIIMRAGLTPTDIMNIKGDFKQGGTAAPALAAKFVANSCGVTPEQLYSTIYDMVKRKLYFNVAATLLKENMPELHKTGITGQLEMLINRGWDMAQGKNTAQLNIPIKTPSVLLGVGAPVHIFLPDVAKALGTKCVIPKLAGVVNAVGAVAGNISVVAEVNIQPQNTEFVVYYDKGSKQYVRLGSATRFAKIEAEKEARQKAAQHGAGGDIVVNVEVLPVKALTAYGTEIFVESRIKATAIGKLEL